MYEGLPIGILDLDRIGIFNRQLLTAVTVWQSYFNSNTAKTFDTRI